jgi:CII-binding regulator of phage lambda lysogenization HflD
VQDIIAPQLEAVKGEISSLRIEIKKLDEKIDSSRNEIKADISRLDEKLLFTNKRLDEALEIRERLAVLEAKIGK